MSPVLLGPAWEARAARWTPAFSAGRGGVTSPGGDLASVGSEFVRPARVPQARPLLPRECVCVCVQGRVCKGAREPACWRAHSGWWRPLFSGGAARYRGGHSVNPIMTLMNGSSPGRTWEGMWSVNMPYKGAEPQQRILTQPGGPPPRERLPSQHSRTAHAQALREEVPQGERG